MTTIMLIILLQFPDIGPQPFQVGPFKTVAACEKVAQVIVGEMQKQRPDVGIGWGCEPKKLGQAI